MKMHSLRYTDMEVRGKNSTMKDSIPKVYPEEEYPYDTRVNFGNEMVKKVPALKDLEVGDEIKVFANAKVVGKNIRANDKKDEITNIDIQLTELGIMDKGNKSDGFNSGAN